MLTTCSAENFETVQALGANHPIDYRTKSVTSGVMELTNNRGVDIVRNSVNGDSGTEDLPRLAFGGHLACIAGLPDFIKNNAFYLSNIHP